MKKNPNHSTYLFEYTWGDRSGKRKARAFNGPKAQQIIEESLVSQYGDVAIASFKLIRKIEPLVRE